MQRAVGSVWLHPELQAPYVKGTMFFIHLFLVLWNKLCAKLVFQFYQNYWYEDICPANWSNTKTSHLEDYWNIFQIFQRVNALNLKFAASF